ncbi:MAG: phosphatase PAP2 family protein [Armatimonadetes bacterium]|nr:phosphatase PAP2 family protein [Armatimonadota bacterium]
MNPMDRSIFYAINRGPDGLDGFLSIFSVGINSWFLRVPLLVLFIGLLWVAGKFRRAAVLAILAWPLTDFTCSLLKKSIEFHRPWVDLTDTIYRWGKVGGSLSGTASSHAGNMAAVATTFWLCLGPKWGIPWAVVALLTGWSRVYGGHHFPSQVLFGWLVGTGIALLVHFVAKKIIASRSPEVPAPELP